MDSKLPKLTNFILPGGGECASTLHISRTICRRAERKVVPLVRENMVDSIVLKFLNRLSDFLFVCARYSANFENEKEIIYKK
jgi:cob(I)alamin adenosyltransferase